jgi:mono/diheme cytochrome c family protein
MVWRIALWLLFAAVTAVCLFAVSAWRSEIPPVEGALSASYDPALVRRGAALAAIGDCAVCHTTPNGMPYAGGRPLPTPIGTIESTNITPDLDTGIGRWPLSAFQRAMNEGVDRLGSHLYPAFPYDHFTLVTNEDNKALYAFLMSRQPVRTAAPVNHLPFPLNIRFLIAGWKLLFLRNERFRTDPNSSDIINRGAYLAEGLGHCGACHTPRNFLGAEQRHKSWSGGESEGWLAYAIDGSSTPTVPWDAASLSFYLLHGWQTEHGLSYGPMATVTSSLCPVPENDVAAIAAYVENRMEQRAPERQQRVTDLQRQSGSSEDRNQQAQSGSVPAGQSLYEDACANCHESGRALPFGALNLKFSTAIHAPNPQNMINIVDFGLPAPDGAAGPIMPGFAGVLDDGQLGVLLNYLRERFGAALAWQNVVGMVAATRSGRPLVTVYRADGTSATAVIADRIGAP